MGIDVQRLRLIIYSLGSALIAVVAIFQIMDLGIDTSTGFGIVILGVIASLIGGMWGMTGIALSSLALGFIENIGLLIFSVHWKYTILFGTLIVLLIFRPKAIFKGLQN
jgi:branched-subunit amino acid ABC-type transport system permease component